MTFAEKEQRVLVTGATSGIGAATVRAFREAGYDVLGVARRTDRLASLSTETGCRTLGADIRDHRRICEALNDFSPDILVNNAGVGHGISGLQGLGADMIGEAIEINVTALIRTTAAAIGGMKARGRGHIVNIGSIAGLHTLVSALYGGTKGAVHLFSQNLRHELRGTGLRVTEICPGRVSSEFYKAAEGDRERLAGMDRSGIAELQPNDVADAIMFAVRAPLHVNVATIELLPTEQAVGGIDLTPASMAAKGEER